MNTTAKQPLRLACLISGGGRTVQNLQATIDRGELHARIVTVICSRADIAGVERCRNLSLNTQVIERRAYNSPAESTAAVWAAIRAVNAELVCLCGYLSLLPIASDYVGRVINIHPALLPKFGGKGMYGHHVHEAVIATGETVSGCTVHYCDDQYDHGTTILQRTCPVHPGDTPDDLADRVFEQECLAYPEAIRVVAQRIR